MITAYVETPAASVQNNEHVHDYAERLVLCLGYNDAICTAVEFQWFNVAEELRFMQDEYRGV